MSETDKGSRGLVPAMLILITILIQISLVEHAESIKKLRARVDALEKAVKVESPK